MDPDDQDEKPLRSQFLRHRSPTFSKEEIQTLVDLVAKHKNIINNKLCNNVALHAKEMAWAKIAKIFNSKGFTHHRNVECLKIKWLNLKKGAKKVSKNLIEDEHGDFDELTSQVVAMVYEAENNTNEISISKDLEDELNDLQSDGEKETKNVSEKYWNENGEKEEDKPNDSTSKHKDFHSRFKKRFNRSMNFTPQECRLLLQCVRLEKKYVFSKETSSRALALKNRAWSRITANFNRQSPHKRSTKMLINKLKNMKKLAKQDEFPSPQKSKIEHFGGYSKEQKEETEGQVKTEPVFALDDDEQGAEPYSPEDDMASNSDQNGDNFDRLHQDTDNVSANAAPDPLSIILNGDSGIGSINMDLFNSENSEVTKLKLDLLKYQLENAKLERKRIEEATAAEARLHETQRTEAALRLRTARLDCVSATARLPPAHPALIYTAEEMPAQQYFDQYHPT